MQRHAPLIGRDSQVHTVAEALRQHGAARTVLVTGRAGSGKTAVVDEARRTVAQEGAKVLRMAWEPGPPGAAALAEAVCGVLARIHDGRLPVRITAVRRAQLGTDGRTGELTLLSTLGETLADAAHHVPFALFLDDAEQLPPRTASALLLMLRVFRPAGVPVVMAGRPAVAGHGAGTGLAAAADTVLALPPLRPQEVGALLEQRFGRPAEPALVAAVVRSLGPLAGNPAAVLSVVTALGECGGLLSLDGRVGLAEPARRLRLTTDTAELGRLGWPGTPPEAGLLRTTATLARLLHNAELRLGDLPSLISLGGPLVGAPGEALGRTVDQLVRDRVLTVDPDGRMSFAVPALATALRMLPTRDDVRAMHAGVARSVADRLGPEATGAGQPRLADHVAAAGPLLEDAPAIRLLLAAARKDARADQPRAARAYLSALRRLRPQDRRTPGVLRESAELSLRHADHAGVLALGEPLLACLKGPDHADRDNLEFATRLWVLASLHEHRSPYADDAAAGFREALRRIPHATALAALGGLYGIGPVTPGQPTAHAGAAADQAAGSGPLPSAAELRLLTASVGSRAELERIRRNLPPGAIGAPAVARLRNAAAYGDLSGALEAVLLDRYVGAGHSTAIRHHAMVRDYLTGYWAGALASARRIETRGRAEGATGTGQLARALAAEIHCLRGDLGRAREWLDLVPDTLAHPLAARARLGVRYWSGQVDEALEGGWRDVRRARESGLLGGVERVLLRILTFTAETAPRTARRALAELEELHEEADTPMTREAVLIGRGVVHRDVDSAQAAYRLVKQRGDLPLALECCQCLAEISDDPQRWLAEAARDTHRLAIGRPVRALLGRSAQRRNVPLPRQRSAREGLSEQDVQLIGMVSDGATNRQIAARLACSEKTVEQRLARLYQRTGRRSRVELAAAWLDGSLARLGLVPDTPSRGVAGPAPWSGRVEM